ncbi:MAG: hypothetical protein Q7V57_12170 [Actinomycetota bacterium]|nr:hypothetical protein [Actinomycetota bacterium]
MSWANGIGTDNDGHVVTHEYIFDFPRMLLTVVVFLAVVLLVRRVLRRRRSRS